MLPLLVPFPSLCDHFNHRATLESQLPLRLTRHYKKTTPFQTGSSRLSPVTADPWQRLASEQCKTAKNATSATLLPKRRCSPLGPEFGPLSVGWRKRGDDGLRVGQQIPGDVKEASDVSPTS